MGKRVWACANGECLVVEHELGGGHAAGGVGAQDVVLKGVNRARRGPAGSGPSRSKTRWAGLGRAIWAAAADLPLAWAVLL